jgi:molybdate transport system regulatory protein
VVSDLSKGGVNTQVKVTLAGGATFSAMITNEAATELALIDGMAVVALFKASHVPVGVPA